MKLNLKKDLTPLKIAATAKVDAEAQAVAGQFITLGPAQSMIYIEKERQAQEVSANPAVNRELVSLVAIDADRYGISMLEAATVILTMAQNWRRLAKPLEDLRLKAHDAINAATTPAEVEAAASVDWSVIA